MRVHFGTRAENWTDEMILTELRGEFSRIIAYEKGLTSKEIEKAKTEAKKTDNMPVKFLKRTRHWTDGGIIGSKKFVQEMACLFDDSKRIMKKRLSSGYGVRGIQLHCFKRLRI